jgi:hypothetical protein
MTSMEAERRRALETERHEIQQRLAEWSQRVERAGATSAADYLFPPLAGCAVAVPMLIAFVLYAVRNFADGTHLDYPRKILLVCIAAFLVAAAIVYFIRRALRSSRIAAAKRAQEMAAGPLEQRLRDVDAMLLRLE